MSRAERAARARALREHGLTYRQIGERMGIGFRTAHDLVSDPDGAKARERKDRYRGRCVECGAPTHGSAGPGNAPKRCHRCFKQEQHDTRYWTRERVIFELQAWAAELGRPPVAEEAQRSAARVRAPLAQREFGSWNRALEAAGLPTVKSGQYRRPARGRPGA